MFIFSILFFFVALIALVMRFGLTDESKSIAGVVSIAAICLSALTLAFSMFTVIPASTIGVQTTFGKIHDQTLPEGAHFVAPWVKIRDVTVATQLAVAKESEAASKDMQRVQTAIEANYNVDPSKARDLFALTPSLRYHEQFVVPSIYETFKAVVALYTAEELITKRAEVSRQITAALNAKLSPYHIQIQNVNMVEFSFSKAFNESIEEKVTASQKALTAERNLERVGFEAKARIAQAEGEAEAIRIQAAAIEKQGGAAYIQLKAIEKWDGDLPTYMSSGAAMPFVNIR